MNIELTEEEAKIIDEALSGYTHKQYEYTRRQKEEIKHRNEDPEYEKRETEGGPSRARLSTSVLVKECERAERELSIAKSLRERLGKPFPL